MYLIKEDADGQVSQMVVALTHDDQNQFKLTHPDWKEFNKLPVLFSVSDQQFSEYREINISFPDYLMPDFCRSISIFKHESSGDKLVAFHYCSFGRRTVKILALNRAISYLCKVYEPFNISNSDLRNAFSLIFNYDK